MSLVIISDRGDGDYLPRSKQDMFEILIVLTHDLWIHAMNKEMDSFGAHNIFNLVTRPKVPVGTLILREGAFAIKTDGTRRAATR